MYVYLYFKYFHFLVDKDNSHEGARGSDTPLVSSEISGVTEQRGYNAEGKC